MQQMRMNPALLTVAAMMTVFFFDCSFDSVAGKSFLDSVEGEPFLDSDAGKPFSDSVAGEPFSDSVAGEPFSESKNNYRVYKMQLLLSPS